VSAIIPSVLTLDESQIVLNCLVDFVSSIRSGRNIDIAGHAGGAIGGLCVAYALKRLQ
jgi:membrane associated rhomboid family serine protease